MPEELIVPLKDAPEWVKRLLQDEHKMRPRTIKVHVGEAAVIPSHWHDADVRYLYAYRSGRVGRISGGGGEDLISASRQEQSLYRGLTIALHHPQDALLLVGVSPKRATLYMHPGAVTGTLSAPEELLSRRDRR